jgi:hypothetical protein
MAFALLGVTMWLLLAIGRLEIFKLPAVARSLRSDRGTRFLSCGRCADLSCWIWSDRHINCLSALLSGARRARITCPRSRQYCVSFRTLHLA